MKYLTRKKNKNKNKHTYKNKHKGGTKRKGNHNINNNNPPSKKTKLSPNNNNFFQSIIPQINHFHFETQNIDVFKSKEESVDFYSNLRKTEPPAYPILNRLQKPLFIAKGLYGCGFKPPIPCIEECRDSRCLDGVSKISKLMSENIAFKELNIYTKLGLNTIEDANKYFIGNPYQCTPIKDFDFNANGCPHQIEKPTLLIYEDGGIDLYQFIKKNRDYDLSLVLKGLINIFKGVGLLNKHNICHFDIKEDNVVLGTDNQNYRLIDFGNAMKNKFFLDNVKKEHIIITKTYLSMNNQETQETQENQETQETQENSENQSVGNVSRKPQQEEIKITVKEPEVIFRILPVYQFFITGIFNYTKKKYQIPSQEEYDLLANKFIETFIVINDGVIDMVRYYYRLIGFFTDNIEHNKKQLKDIFDKLYKQIKENPKDTTDLIYNTLDMYSLGLLILKLVMYKSKERPISNLYFLQTPVIQFMMENKLLDPNPFEHLPIDTVIQKYEEFILLNYI
jgi:serine/threonine protein kinase